MPTTLGDYLAHGLEMGLVVGPPALAAVASILALGWVLARWCGRGGAAPVALAAAYIAAHFAVGGAWADAFASPGAERLAALAIVALALGLVEARFAARVLAIAVARALGAVAVAWAIVPARLVGAEWWTTAASLAVGTWSGAVVLGWAARRSDPRAYLLALAPALGALGGVAIQYGVFATLGQRAIGLGVSAGALATVALVLGWRGAALSAEGVGATAIVLGAGVLGVAQVHGSLPVAVALVAFAAMFAPVLAVDRARWRRRAVIATAVGIALVLGAVAVAEWSAARAAELEREKAKERTPVEGGYDPDYEYGPDSGGSGSGNDLPY